MIALLAACTRDDPPRGDDDDATDTAVVDTAVPTGTGTTAGPFSDVAWALDPEFGSLVRVTWTQTADADVHVEFAVDPGRWRSSPVRTLAPGPHEELLVGVPYGERVTFRLVADDGASTPDREARAGASPDGLEWPSVRVDGPADPEVPWILLSVTPPGGDFGGRWWAMIVDRQGRVVWARRADPGKMTMHPRLTWDEDALLLDQNSFWTSFDRGAAGTILRTTLDGRDTHVFTTPGLHHPFAPTPDGAVVYGNINERIHEEHLTRVDPVTDAATDLWSCQGWLADLGIIEHYCASNTINYDPRTDAFLFSFYSFESILEIDAGTHEVRRWFGHLDGAWAFDPPQSAFWWQHGGHYLPDGHLITSSHDLQEGTEILVREYALDERAETLREVYNMDLGDGLWGFERNQMGEVARLPSGNTLHNLGTYPRIREGTPDGEIVWDVEFSILGDLGRTTPIRDLYRLLAPRD